MYRGPVKAPPPATLALFLDTVLCIFILVFYDATYKCFWLVDQQIYQHSQQALSVTDATM